MLKQSGMKGLATKSGLHPDRMREVLQEEGLLDEGSTLNDMWALVDRHMRGQTRGLSGETSRNSPQRTGRGRARKPDKRKTP